MKQLKDLFRGSKSSKHFEEVIKKRTDQRTRRHFVLRWALHFTAGQLRFQKWIKSMDQNYTNYSHQHAKHHHQLDVKNTKKSRTTQKMLFSHYQNAACGRGAIQQMCGLSYKHQHYSRQSYTMVRVCLYKNENQSRKDSPKVDDVPAASSKLARKCRNLEWVMIYGRQRCSI